MKNILFGIVILGITSINYAFANCSTTLLTTKGDIRSVVRNKTLCISYPATNPNHPFKGQEEHFFPSGELWDYKEGDGDAIDPRKRIGFWGITDTPQIRYSYTGGSTSYFFDVYDNSDGTYSFCNAGTEHAVASVVPSTNFGCSTYP